MQDLTPVGLNEDGTRLRPRQRFGRGVLRSRGHPAARGTAWRQRTTRSVGDEDGKRTAPPRHPGAHPRRRVPRGRRRRRPDDGRGDHALRRSGHRRTPARRAERPQGLAAPPHRRDDHGRHARSARRPSCTSTSTRCTTRTSSGTPGAVRTDAGRWWRRTPWPGGRAPPSSPTTCPAATSWPTTTTRRSSPASCAPPTRPAHRPRPQPRRLSSVHDPGRAAAGRRRDRAGPRPQGRGHPGGRPGGGHRPGGRHRRRRLARRRPGEPTPDDVPLIEEPVAEAPAAEEPAPSEPAPRSRPPPSATRTPSRCATRTSRRRSPAPRSARAGRRSRRGTRSCSVAAPRKTDPPRDGVTTPTPGAHDSRGYSPVI